MTAPSPADIAVYRALTATERTERREHENMWDGARGAYMKGVAECPHRLTSTGVDVAMFMSSDSLEDYWKTFVEAPYRHHEYAHDGQLDSQWCYCGNREGNAIHQLCGEEL